MTRRDTTDDDERSSPSETPWHNRTPELLGASLLAVLVIGIVIFAVSFVARQFSEPEEAPLNFVDPTFSVSATDSPTTTTTPTITSTSPPVTTEIGGPLEPATSPTTTSGSETSSSETTAEEETETATEEESTERTTRRGPRTNVTRTLYPRP